jgi:MFS family permease
VTPSREPGGDELNAVTQGNRPIYYGWWVLGAGAITEMLAIGSTSYAAGLFVLPLERELSLSRAAASSALPLVFSGGLIAAMVVGYLLDRFPVQRVLSIGAVLLGAGFVLISTTSSPAMMALALLLPVAFGFVAIGPLTTTTLVSRWFHRRRGRALGLATVATSGGGIVVVPLLSWAIESYGWRIALQIEGFLITAIVLALSALVIRSGPGELGLETHAENDGRPPGEIRRKMAPSVSPLARRWRLREFASTFNFWAVAVSLAAITGISQAVVVTIVPYAVGLGASPGSAALLISVFSVSAAMAKLSSGLLVEIVDRRVVMFASACAMLLAMLVLLWSSDYVMLLLACCLVGTSLGCILPSAPALVAEYFGSNSFGTIMGAMYAATGISSIISVAFVGAVFDRAGNYDQAFMAFMLLSLGASAAIVVIRPTLVQLGAAK